MDYNVISYCNNKYPDNYGGVADLIIVYQSFFLIEYSLKVLKKLIN